MWSEDSDECERESRGKRRRGGDDGMISDGHEGSTSNARPTKKSKK
jgi:hypothetical protein